MNKSTPAGKLLAQEVNMAKTGWFSRQSTPVKAVVVIGGVFVGLTAISAITGMLNSASDVASADNQDECASSCSEVASNAVSNKSWWKSKTSVYDDSFSSCMESC